MNELLILNQLNLYVSDHKGQYTNYHTDPLHAFNYVVNIPRN